MAPSSEIDRSFETALLRGDSSLLLEHYPIACSVSRGNFDAGLGLPVAVAALAGDVDASSYPIISVYTAGVSCLLAFIRDNWAGPRAVTTQSDEEDDIAFSLVRDGEDAAAALRNPRYLIAARTLLIGNLNTLIAGGAQLAPWWAARVVLVQNAMLSAPTPTLQDELFHLFSRFLGEKASRSRFLFNDILPMKRPREEEKPEDNDDSLFPELGGAVDEEDEIHCVLPDPKRPEENSLAVFAYLELALAQRSFYDSEGAADSVNRATEFAKMEVSVRGELGMRTKYQQKATAQLIARAYSAIDSGDGDAQRTYLTGLSMIFPGLDSSSDTDVCEKLPLPEDVPVNDTDALGYIKLIEKQDSKLDDCQQPGRDERTEIHNLTPLDQAVVLAHAAVTVAGNAEHNLTNQQTAPYVNLVLKNAQCPLGTSSLVQVKALIMRADIESDRGRFLERCMAQMEIVNKFIDDPISDSPVTARHAAVAERAFMALSSGVPPFWELKKQLAMALGKIGLVKSAMDIFEQLQFWDELVDCHRLLGNIGAARQLIDQQLDSLDNAVRDAPPEKKSRATQARTARRPRLLCVLGDVTRDTSYFETAWEESGKRYTRAKRALGRFYVDTGKWELAISHLRDALALNPLYPDVWFSYGCAALEIHDYRTAAQAFTQVVRQIPEFGEAWNNLARALAEQGKKQEALSALMQAARVMRDTWRIWDNVLVLATETRSIAEAIRAIDRLLELRGRDAEISRALVLVTEAVCDLARSSKKDDTESAVVHTKRLLPVLGRATSTVSTNAAVWQAYAEIHQLVPGAGGKKKAFDCRMKQVRALALNEDWKRELRKFRAMVVASIALAELAIEIMDENALKNADNHLESIVLQTVLDLKNDVGFQKIEGTLNEVRQAIRKV